MKKTAFRRLWLTLAAGLIAAAMAGGRAWAAPITPATAEANAPLRLTLLHVNDVHGHTQPHLFGGRSVGGYSRLATRVAGIRSAGDANLVLLVNAGDEFSRGDDLTRRTLGRANVQLMNYLRFDAWVPGNGDFYDGVGNLRQRAGEANFPTLAANVAASQPRSAPAGAPAPAPAEAPRPFPPYAILPAGPLRVALVGLCTVYSGDAARGGLQIADPVETAAALVSELRRKADVVVVLSHLGILEDVKLAKRVAGIDVILGGHTHTILEKGLMVQAPDGRDVLLCQAGEHLRYLGCAELSLRPAAPSESPGQPAGAWRVQSARARLLPLDDSVPEDPGVKALIARQAAATSRPGAPTSRPAGLPAAAPAAR